MKGVRRFTKMKDNEKSPVRSLDKDDEADDDDEKRKTKMSSKKLNSDGGEEIALGEEGTTKPEEEESWWSITWQVSLWLVIAGFGMVGAGLLLSKYEKWAVFKKVPELIVLTTPLVGLKGDLEMTVASRLSTQVNLGNMETWWQRFYLCASDLALTQVQATVVAILSVKIAILMQVCTGRVLTWQDALLLYAAALITSCLACVVLGLLMSIMVVVSQLFKCNPDNVTTPVAAALGDTVTLIILANFASMLYDEKDSRPWIAGLMIALVMIPLPAFIWVSYRLTYTREVLMSFNTGWLPIIMSMIFSSCGGLFLDVASDRYSGVALYQPVINGVGGNQAAILASRICTTLHRTHQVGTLPPSPEGAPGKVLVTPWSIFCGPGIDKVAAVILLVVTIPAHLLFITVSYFVATADSGRQLTAVFIIVYLISAIVQVLLLLYITQVLVNLFWKCKYDPDTCTIPYLTALGDLFGTALLFICFEVVVHTYGLEK